MKFRTRKLVKPGDLNARGTLFGGQLLKWIDEEAAIYVLCKLGTPNIVTKWMSEIDFVSTAKVGDVIQIGCDLVNVGNTSITIRCEVQNKQTGQTIIKIDKIVFVSVDDGGKPTPHGGVK
jgi:acyl-CoA hydrolase